jgi:uncharacterized membrane-anchored protein
MDSNTKFSKTELLWSVILLLAVIFIILRVMGFFFAMPVIMNRVLDVFGAIFIGLSIYTSYKKRKNVNN